MNDKNILYMNRAIEQARLAFDADEVPVGAVLVKDDIIIAESFNTNQRDSTPINHAEINVINMACKKFKTKDLSGTSLYVTLEPCMMCTGAIKSARISKVYFSTFDLKYGYFLSNDFYKADKDIIWQVGLLSEESRDLLQAFFRNKREV